MKALVATEYGQPAQVLEIMEMPVPEPGAGEVVVRVEAAALNPFDLKVISGALREHLPVRHPLRIGMDVAGVVARVGDGVTGFAEDDPVFGLCGLGAGAVGEYAAVTAGPLVARRPRGLDAVRAAAIPEAGLTALHLLRVAELKPGQTMLVIGATGGIGMFVVQLAAGEGVEVIATGAPDDAEYLRALGASHVIDYTGLDVIDETRRLLPDGADVVLDLVHSGTEIIDSGVAARPSGRVVSPLSGPQDLGRDVTGIYIGQMSPEPGDLDELGARAEAGLRIELGAVHPFGEAPQAVADFADRHIRGKVVITV